MCFQLVSECRELNENADSLYDKVSVTSRDVVPLSLHSLSGHQATNFYHRIFFGSIPVDVHF